MFGPEMAGEPAAQLTAVQPATGYTGFLLYISRHGAGHQHAGGRVESTARCQRSAPAVERHSISAATSASMACHLYLRSLCCKPSAVSNWQEMLACARVTSLHAHRCRFFGASAQICPPTLITSTSRPVCIFHWSVFIFRPRQYGSARCRGLRACSIARHAHARHDEQVQRSLCAQLRRQVEHA